MADSLNTLITKIQALLGDNGTRFSTATCTAALRQALSDFNLVAPVHAGTLLEVVSGQYEYDLSNEPDCANLIRVLSVHKQGPNANERDLPLAYDAYFEDNRPYIRLRNPHSAGFLIVRFTLPNTISGLDGATQSTLESHFDQVMVDGGCMHACHIRAASLPEANNLNKNTVEHYERLARFYKLAFDAGMALASQRRAPAGEPNIATWPLDTARKFDE